MPSSIALLAAIAPIVVGILGLIGTRWVAGIQSKARANEEQLKRYEGYDHTYNNLRTDYDRVVEENVGLRAELRRVRAERDSAVSKVGARDRQIERWIEAKEARTDES